MGSVTRKNLRSPRSSRLLSAGSGFYAWCVQPESKRAKEGKCLLGHIQQSRLESRAVYGDRKVSDDLRDLGERWGTTIARDRCAHFRVGWPVGRRMPKYAQVRQLLDERFPRPPSRPPVRAFRLGSVVNGIYGQPVLGR